MNVGVKQSVDSSAVLMPQNNGRVNLQQQFRKGRYRQIGNQPPGQVSDKL